MAVNLKSIHTQGVRKGNSGELGFLPWHMESSTAKKLTHFHSSHNLFTLLWLIFKVKCQKHMFVHNMIHFW